MPRWRRKAGAPPLNPAIAIVWDSSEATQTLGLSPVFLATLLLLGHDGTWQKEADEESPPPAWHQAVALPACHPASAGFSLLPFNEMLMGCIINAAAFKPRALVNFQRSHFYGS